MDFPTALFSASQAGNGNITVPPVNLLSIGISILVLYAYYWFLTKMRKGNKNPSSVLRFILVLWDVVNIIVMLFTVYVVNSSLIPEVDNDNMVLVTVLIIAYALFITSRVYIITGYGKGALRKNLITVHIGYLFLEFALYLFMIASSFF